MTYPREPGWHSGAAETSRQAALDLRPVAKRHADLVLGVIRDRGNASAEEVTAELAERGQPIILNSVRARICCAHKLGVVQDSGERAIGQSGRCKVVRWRLSTRAERAAFDARREAA